MTFKVIRGQGQAEEMTSVPYRDYFYTFFSVLHLYAHLWLPIRCIDLYDVSCGCGLHVQFQLDAGVYIRALQLGIS